MTFSWVTLDALDTIGILVTPQEREAYIHTWNVVGHLLGLERRMLPESFDDAGRLWARVAERQHQPSTEGQELTRALLQMLEYTLPGTAFDGLPSSIMRHLMGNDVADMLGVPLADWTETLRRVLRVTARGLSVVADESESMNKLVRVFSRELIESLSWISRGGERTAFTIPETLRDSWGMRSVPAL
jgi:hypothetical protein